MVKTYYFHWLGDGRQSIDRDLDSDYIAIVG